MACRGHLAYSPPQSNTDLSIVRSISPSMQPLGREESLMYYVNMVLPRFQLADNAFTLDLDGVQDESLQLALVAVSQAHYSLSSKIDESSALLDRRKARQNAIETFRERLQLGVDSGANAQQLFAINILFCILDGMIEPSGDFNASILHLKGGFAMLEQFTETPAQMLVQSGWQSHLLSIFATIDLVHALLSGDKPYFESMMWNMFAEVQSWFGCLQKGNRFLKVLKVFSDMASLGNLVSCRRDNATVVERCLPPIELELKELGLQQGDDKADETVSTWNTFCSIYELSGSIYLQRALRLKPVDDADVQRLTRQAVELLVEDPLPGMMRHCTIFPLLIIGSHCILGQDRRVIMDNLSPSSSYLSFGNMSVMNDFLQSIWTNSDHQISWWNTYRTISQKAFLF